jgi:hypothetical protein
VALQLSSIDLALLIDLLNCYLADTPEMLVLGAQRVHERIGIFRRDVLISVPMESNGLNGGLMGLWTIAARAGCRAVSARSGERRT